MALPPQKFREIVFQLLYSADFPEAEVAETASMLMAELKVTRKIVLQAKERVQAVLSEMEAIDSRIASLSKEYTFERISRVEKTVLRLGMYELLFDPSLPPLVVLSEAVRLTRKFGSPEGAQFVNAILDKIYHAQTC